jgi:hypothetical protein
MATAQAGGCHVPTEAPVAKAESIVRSLERHHVVQVEQHPPSRTVAYSSEHLGLLSHRIVTEEMHHVQ